MAPAHAARREVPFCGASGRPKTVVLSRRSVVDPRREIADSVRFDEQTGRVVLCASDLAV